MFRKPPKSTVKKIHQPPNLNRWTQTCRVLLRNYFIARNALRNSWKALSNRLRFKKRKLNRSPNKIRYSYMLLISKNTRTHTEISWKFSYNPLCLLRMIIVRNVSGKNSQWKTRESPPPVWQMRSSIKSQALLNAHANNMLWRHFKIPDLTIWQKFY